MCCAAAAVGMDFPVKLIMLHVIAGFSSADLRNYIFFIIQLWASIKAECGAIWNADLKYRAK